MDKLPLTKEEKDFFKNLENHVKRESPDLKLQPIKSTETEPNIFCEVLLDQDYIEEKLDD